MSSSTARYVMIFAGLALVVGFFLPWIDLGFGPSASGFTIVRASEGGALLRMMMFAVPIGGAAMIYTAATQSKHARLTSVITGLALVGYGVIKTVHTFFAVSGLGLWIVVGGAFAALAAPLLIEKSSKSSK